MPKKNLKSIKGVEIFSAGTWNGDIYTTKDLDNMVKAFQEVGESVRPFLKLGHDEEQKLIQNDGLPAAGWIGNLYRSGQKLLADFIDIPEKIYELIVNKAYRKVSSEIYWNITVNDKKYPYMLGAVALLGSDIPGVMNLNDILALYGMASMDGDGPIIKSYADGQEDVTVKSYSLEISEEGDESMPRTEREIELEAQLKAEKEAREKVESEMKTYTTKASDTEKTLEEIRAENEALKKKAFAAEVEAKNAKIEAFVDGMVSEKLITKGMKSLFTALLGDEPTGEKKTYSIQSGEKTEEMDKFELVKNIAKQFSLASAVNFEENSEDGDDSSDSKTKAEEVETYAEKHGISFSEAYRKMFKGKLKPSKHLVTETADAE